MKLTPWFDGSVKPVREGWFQRKWDTGTRMDWWDGLEWCAFKSHYPYWNQDESPWRGLAQQPKGKK